VHRQETIDITVLLPQGVVEDINGNEMNSQLHCVAVDLKEEQKNMEYLTGTHHTVQLEQD